MRLNPSLVPEILKFYRSAATPELKAALVTIFMTTPSLASLEARLKGRGTEAPDLDRARRDAARIDDCLAPRRSAVR